MNEQDDAPGVTIAGIPAVADYLVAHDRKDAEAVVATMTEDVVVADDGSTYRGPDEVRAWVERSSTEYRYTSRVIAADVVDPARPVVVMHLSGDFPGGEVDLAYRFVLEGGRIASLAIEVAG